MRLTVLALTAFSLVLTGCATAPIAYYYGNYSRTLYHAKKDGTPASELKYKDALLDIIQTSEKKSLRVPPGIYCEFGYLLAREGDSGAEKYFNLEVQTYPESAQFVTFLRTQIQK